MKAGLPFWRGILTISLLAACTAMLATSVSLAEHGISLFTSKWGIPFYLLAALLAALLAFTFSRRGRAIIEKWDRQQPAAGNSRIAALLFFLLLMLFFAVFYAFPISSLPQGSLERSDFPFIIQLILKTSWTRVAAFWFISLAGMTCLRTYFKNLGWLSALGCSGLFLAAAYTIAIRLAAISNYPFSLGWSEVSRTYGASLFFAQQIYGRVLPLPAMHPTWHLMLTVPFFFGSLPIWVHRAWQVLLQVGLTAGVGITLARRLKLSPPLWFWGFSAWSLLFLVQEKMILVHLMACVLFLFLGLKSASFRRTTLVVLLASVWTGLSRLNWFPVPGLIAALLYFLEIPRQQVKETWKYAWKPLFWVVSGTGLAFFANRLYNQFSGNNITGGQFASSLSSDLLWYRLMPNPSNPVGILISVFLVSLPVLLILLSKWREISGKMHPLRVAGVIAVLLLLLAGGLLVSLKIGGGSDLHNMDAYLTVLLLASGYVIAGRWAPEAAAAVTGSNRWPLVLLAAILPIGWAALTSTPLRVWDQGKAAAALDSIRSQAEITAGQGREVLFISQRHLLALEQVKLPLVAEYEQDYLMEMAMSRNRAYLDQFQQDLKDQRFGLIIAGQYSTHPQGRGSSFGDENDRWVEEVALPLNCYYEMTEIYEGDSLGIYKPRSSPCE